MKTQKLPILLGGALLTLSPSLARAEVIPLSIGARAGYTLTDSPHYVPLQLDVMLHANSFLRIGAYGSYAPAVSDKPAGVDSSSIKRVGVQVHVRFPSPVVTPWVGIGTGYWALSAEGKLPSLPGSKLEVTGSGWEQVNLQAGAQFTLLPLLSLGPYLQYERVKSGTAKATLDGQPLLSRPFGSDSTVQAGLRAEVSF